MPSLPLSDPKNSSNSSMTTFLIALRSYAFSYISDPDSLPDPDPDSDSLPLPDPEPDPDALPLPDPEPDPDALPLPDSDPEPDPDPLPDPEPDPDTLPDPEPDPDPLPDPDPDPDTLPDPEPLSPSVYKRTSANDTRAQSVHGSFAISPNCITSGAVLLWILKADV